MGHMWERRCIEDSGGGNLKKRGQFENLGADGRIILKFIFKNMDG